MSYIRELGPIVPGGDGWDVFHCDNSPEVYVQVVNGGVDYQLSQGPDPMRSTWDVGISTLLPGNGTLRGGDLVQAVRFRNHSPVSSPAPEVFARADVGPFASGDPVSWTPGYVTIGADGSIGADFTGQVQAKGLQLDAAAPANQQVTWVDYAGTYGPAGGKVAKISQSAGGQLTMESDPAGTNLAQTVIQANAADGSFAYMGAQDDPHGLSTHAGSSAAHRSLWGTLSPSQDALILNDLGESSFLQIATLQNGGPQAKRWRLWGSSTGGAFSAATGVLAAGGTKTVTITHGLATSSILPVGALNDITWGMLCAWDYSIPDANDININFRNVGSISAQATLFFYLLQTG